MEFTKADDRVQPSLHETEMTHEGTALITQNICNVDEKRLESNEEDSILNNLIENALGQEAEISIIENSGLEEDTGGIDLQTVNKIKNVKFHKETRRMSWEQCLKGTFTLKHSYNNEITQRVIEVVVKYALFVFNFCSWVLAVAAIALGIWMKLDKALLVKSDTEVYLNMPLLICVGGGVTFVVASMGCIGALRENLVLLRVFFYVLTVILIGEMTLVSAVVIVYTVPEARDTFLKSQPEKILSSAIQNYMDDMQTKMWVDKVQAEFRCCGIAQTDEGFRDWQSNVYFNCTPFNKSIYRCAVPTSCCIFEKGDRVNTMCGFDMTDKPIKDVRDYIYTRGCIIGLGEWLGKYHSLIIISCISIIIMQSLAVLSAKLMVVRITKKRTRWRSLQDRHNIAKEDTL